MTTLFSLLAPLLTLAQAGSAQASTAAAPSDTGSFVIWGILLLGLALVLFMIEILLPSAGILGVASVISLVIGVVMLFQVNTISGLIGALAAVVALPFAVTFAFKIWPETPIGRLLILKSPNDPLEDKAADEPDTPATPRRHTATATSVTVGMRGKALTTLRPVGTCIIDGKREECLAQGGVIEAGTPVQVVAVDGRQICVRAD